MDQYLSTYRKDFIWPYARKFPIHGSPKTYSEKVLTCKSAGNGRVPCACGPEQGDLMAPTKNSGPPVAEAHQWTAPLLDPQLHPGKIGPAPEFEITLCDRPSSTYLKKLEEKYPYLYNVLKSAPPDDMTRRINQYRLRTTYQVDYGHTADEQLHKNLLAKAGIRSELINKSVPYNIRPSDYSDTTTNHPARAEDFRERVYGTGEFGGTFQEDANHRDGFIHNAREFQDSREATTNKIEPLEHDSGRDMIPRQSEHSREATKKEHAFKDESPQSGRGAHEDYRETENTHRGESGGRDGRIIKSGDGVEAFVRSAENNQEKLKALPAWRSEYQEVIGQTGYDIIRDKIHRHGARSSGRSFIERIIMKCRTF